MKITVIGPIPRDIIITHNNETIYKYSCATHPAIALAKSLKDKGEVNVISRVHKKDNQAIKKFFPFSKGNLNGMDITRGQRDRD